MNTKTTLANLVGFLHEKDYEKAHKLVGKIRRSKASDVSRDATWVEIEPLLESLEEYTDLVIETDSIGHKRHVGRLRNKLETLAPKVKTVEAEVLPFPGEEKKAKTKKAKTPENDCLCGCGNKVRGSFKQGHDQRCKGYISRAIDQKGILFLQDLPTTLQPHAEALAKRWGYEFTKVNRSGATAA